MKNEDVPPLIAETEVFVLQLLEKFFGIASCARARVKKKKRCGDEGASLPPAKKQRCDGTPSTHQLLAITRACVVLSHVFGHTCTGAGVRPSERDLYYSSTHIFGSQAQVSRSIRCVGQWLSRAPTRSICANEVEQKTRLPYSREELGITAAPKSILVGCLEMDVRMPQSLHVDRLHVEHYGAGGMLLSGDVALGIEAVNVLDNAGLIIVEKEASLRSLVEMEVKEHQLLRASPREHSDDPRLFFMTTKGYPCVAARTFLQRIHRLAPQWPMAAVVDGDPHGIAITLCYMGVQLRGDEPTTCATVSDVLPIRWVGTRPSVVQAECLLHTTDDDLRLLTRLMQRISAVLQKLPPSAIVARESMTMMMSEVMWMMRHQRKCEIQQGYPCIRDLGRVLREVVL